MWGRFVNADLTLGLVGGLLNHNLYGYCFGQPINCYDPDGKIPIVEQFVSSGFLNKITEWASATWGGISTSLAPYVNQALTWFETAKNAVVAGITAAYAAVSQFIEDQRAKSLELDAIAELIDSQGQYRTVILLGRDGIGIEGSAFYDYRSALALAVGGCDMWTANKKDALALAEGVAIFLGGEVTLPESGPNSPCKHYHVFVDDTKFKAHMFYGNVGVCWDMDNYNLYH